MTLSTRRPTGKPPWPIMLITGPEKVGKSYSCAQASSSDLIGRTFWVGVGEDAPDEYGAVPGARFEIVEHDGTYRGILRALIDAKQEPAKGKPNLIVLDSATRLWDLLTDMSQAEANRRAIAKAKKFNKQVPDEDVTVGPDLWNIAKSRWQNILDVLREHQGPSIVTARLERVMVVDKDGQPTKDKVDKIKAEKGLGADVGVIVEIQSLGDAYLTGVRSVRLAGRQGRTSLPKFTVDKVWRDLGLAEKDATAPRQFTTANGAASLDVEDELPGHRAALLDRLRAAAPDPGKLAGQWVKDHGHKITETTDLDSLAALVATYESVQAVA